MKNCTKMIEEKENGITLIALVVTIIVLLILASVTISSIIRRQLTYTKNFRCERSIRNREHKRASKNGYNEL